MHNITDQARSRRLIRAAVAATVVACGASAASAQTEWTAGTGDYNDAANWTNGVPTLLTDALIANGGTAQLDANGFALNLTVGDAGGAGTLDVLSSGLLDFDERLTVGNDGSGVVMIAGGGMTGSEVWLGQGAGGTATFELTGAATGTFDDYFVVGREGGSATMTMGGTSLVTKTNNGLTAFIVADGVDATTTQTTGTLVMNDDSRLVADSEFWVGNNNQNSQVSGFMTMNQNASVEVSSYFVLGRLGATGTMTLNDDASLVKTSARYGHVIIGGNSPATLTLNGRSRVEAQSPTNATPDGQGGPNSQVWIGNGGSGNGTVEMYGESELVGTSYMVVGRAGGTGSLTMYDDSSVFKNFTGGGQFIIADNATGTMTMRDRSDLRVLGEVWIGQNTEAVGSLVMREDSALSNDFWFSIGRQGGSGTVEMYDNASIRKTRAGQFIIGGFQASGTNGSDGTLLQYGNSSVVSEQEAWWAENSQSTAVHEMYGTSTFSAASWMTVGRGGTAAITLNDSAVLSKTTNNGRFILGDSGNASLTLNDDSAVDIAGGQVFVGRTSQGTLVVNDNATFTVGSGFNLDIGVQGGGKGTVTQSGGLVTANAVVLAVPLDGNAPNGDTSATYNLNGGVLETGAVFRGAAGGTVAFNFNGGTLRATGDQGDFYRLGPADSEILAGGARIDTNGFNVGIVQTLDGTGGLTKAGAGTLTLAADQLFAGDLNVDVGTLVLNGSLASANVVVADGAVLAGTGTANAVTSAGDVSPGGDGVLGTLSASASTLTGLLSIDLDGTDAGAADLFDVSGTLDLTGAGVDFNVLSSLDDDAYVFASYGNLIGTFANGLLPSGYALDYSYNGNNIALVAATTIPEPTTVVMGLLGGGLLLTRRRSA